LIREGYINTQTAWRLNKPTLISFKTRKIRCKYEPENLSRYRDGLQAGRRRFDSRQGKDICPYCTTFKPVTGLTHMGYFPRAEAEYYSSSSIEIKNGGAMSPQPHTSSWLAV
jgi:hypothetical protein